MTYFVFTRMKNATTRTYVVVRANDAALLPSNAFHGAHVIPGPWEFRERVESGGPYPHWFSPTVVDQQIDRHGYFLVDMEVAYQSMGGALTKPEAEAVEEVLAELIMELRSEQAASGAEQAQAAQSGSRAEDEDILPRLNTSTSERAQAKTQEHS